MFFFFNDTATTEIYTLSLHDALPIYPFPDNRIPPERLDPVAVNLLRLYPQPNATGATNFITNASALDSVRRSEEHTSELQSRQYLVCRLLLEKKKQFHIVLSLVYQKH